jgi:undecaprenyl-diphosphatase
MERLFQSARRLSKFLARHRWSIPLTLLSALFFAELAEEVREGELKTFDSAVTDFVARGRGPLDAIMLALTHFGGGRPMLVLCVLAMLALVLAKRPRDAAFVGLAGGGAAALNWLLKLAFQRARPEAPFLVALPDSFSFPSGHAMGSTGVLASLLVVAHVVGLKPFQRVLAITCTLTLIVGIGASRVYLGVHYPSDVIGGQLAGAGLVSALTGWFYPRLLPGEASGEQPPEPGVKGNAPG